MVPWEGGAAELQEQAVLVPGQVASVTSREGAGAARLPDAVRGHVEGLCGSRNAFGQEDARYARVWGPVRRVAWCRRRAGKPSSPHSRQPRTDVSSFSALQLRRAGRWASETMVNAYLSHLPKKFMRRVAGFTTEEGGYFLPRAQAEPQTELLWKIWP